MKAIVLIFFILVTSVHAGFLEPEWLKATHGKIRLSTQDKSLYPFVHIKRENAQPVVLLHGIGGNHHNWMDFGPALYKMGYDVWAFRWSVRQDRDLDGLATETLPKMLKHVQKVTGQKPVLIGHSLGGIISKIFLLGLRKDSNGEYFIDKKAKREVKNLVKGFVSVSSPNGVDTASLKYFMPLFENLPTHKIYGTADLSQVIYHDRVSWETAIVKTIEFNTLGLRLPLLNDFMNIVFHMPYHDHSDYNVGSLVRFGISPVPEAVREQIRLLGDEIRQDEDQVSLSKVLFEEKRPIPFAFIAGENDPVASSQAIEKEAGSQSSAYLELSEAGHLDPLFGDMLVESLLFVNRFILSLP